MKTYPVSIIIPNLNDFKELQGLLVNLSAQRGITAEIIICNGGSDSDLQERLSTLTIPFPIRIISTDRGRGLQMNIGAGAASSELLLFLHADSRFDQPNALQAGLEFYQSQCKNSVKPCSARFRLHFRHSTPHPSLAYFFHEAKARLNRGDCIRGDQGYLIEKSTFLQLGGFDEALPFLEDVRMASLIAAQGEWGLLPHSISTSARRFEQEGYFERQVANVIIVNAVETGWNELLSALPGLYNCTASGRLQLHPLLMGVCTLIDGHNRGWRTRFWDATGRHVAANAWQLFFWLDVRKAFCSGCSPDEVTPVWLERYEKFLKPLFNSRLAGLAAQQLARLWLWWMLRVTRKTSTL